MQPIAPPPDWLKPGAIAHHIPTSTLFIAERLTSDGANYRVYDAPAGMSGNSYDLCDCRLATLSDCVSTTLYTRGQPVSVVRDGNLLVIGAGKHNHRFRVVSAFDRNVQSFANFFRGEVVKGDVDEILEPFGGEANADGA